MGTCVSKARKITKQEEKEKAVIKKETGEEIEKRELRRVGLLSDSDSEEEKRWNHRGELLSQNSLPYYTAGAAEYRKISTGQFAVNCAQHQRQYCTCPIKLSQRGFELQRVNPHCHSWKTEDTHNSWRSNNRGRGQGASYLSQERNYRTSSPADTYRVPRSRGYRFEKQRAAEERRDQIAKKVTPLLGESKPAARYPEKKKHESDESADILRAAAQMFEANEAFFN